MPKVGTGKKAKVYKSVKKAKAAAKKTGKVVTLWILFCKMMEKPKLCLVNTQTNAKLTKP